MHVLLHETQQVTQHRLEVGVTQEVHLVNYDHWNEWETVGKATRVDAQRRLLGANISQVSQQAIQRCLVLFGQRRRNTLQSCQAARGQAVGQQVGQPYPRPGFEILAEQAQQLAFECTRGRGKRSHSALAHVVLRITSAARGDHLLQVDIERKQHGSACGGGQATTLQHRRGLATACCANHEQMHALREQPGQRLRRAAPEKRLSCGARGSLGLFGCLPTVGLMP